MKLKQINLKMIFFLALLVAIFVLILFTLNKYLHKTKEIKYQTEFHFDLDSIKYVKILKDSTQYLIEDSNIIKNIIKVIDSSSIEFIKFGSSNDFELYNKKDLLIFSASFRDNRFKSNGIVFKSKYNIFPNNLDSAIMIK